MAELFPNTALLIYYMNRQAEAICTQKQCHNDDKIYSICKIHPNFLLLPMIVNNIYLYQ